MKIRGTPKMQRASRTNSLRNMKDQKNYFGIFAGLIETFVHHSQTFLTASTQIDEEHLVAPRLSLKAHSLELALKAFVLAARLNVVAPKSAASIEYFQYLKDYGAKGEEVLDELSSKKFGHNLSRLWTEAVRLGYDWPTGTPSWLHSLSELQTGDYALRYPKPATAYEIPSPSDEISIEKAINYLVGQATSIHVRHDLLANLGESN